MYNITETKFKGLYIFEPQVFTDGRGYFFESYNAEVWKAAGIETVFVQDNESQSKFGTVRGLHYQIPDYAQSKLVRVTSGEVIDVVVDLRKNQDTYGKYFSITLSQDNKKQLLIPRGFAHGFVTISDQATFNYKCDNYYNKESEFGIHPLDETLNIDWKIESKNMILSEKDKAQPTFGSHTPYEQS